MKRFLTTRFFGAILGIVIGGAPADASLISRGFLDEVLTDYATNTALDLKANKADLTDLSDKIGTLPDGKNLAGMISETDAKIGTLPDGDIRTSSSGLRLLLPIPSFYTYPTSIGDYMELMYSDYLGLSGLAQAVYYGNESTGQTDTALQVKGLRQITDEIGTLPSGNFPIFPYHEILSDIGQPLTYPTSLAELITAIYGNSETNTPGLLAAIIVGLPLDTDGDGQSDSYVSALSNFYIAQTAFDLAHVNHINIGTVPDGKNLAGMIGTLPTGYDSVGAALTAMDAKIDARELPSTSADGQYVLSAKKVGDTITYTWVKMDLTSEEQAQ